MTLQTFTLGTFSQGEGAAGGAFESIATATVSTATGTITFNSIPSTYQHIQLRFIARTANATTDSSGYLRINGDAATNYSWHWLYGTGASVAVSKGATQDKIQIAANYPGSSYSTNIYGVGIIDIHDYASTTKNKTVRIFNGVENNSGTTSSKVNLVSGARFNTAAITSISLTGFNDFATGSTFALYGIKGA